MSPGQARWFHEHHIWRKEPMYLLQGDNEVDRERAADAATVHLLHLQFILAQVVAVDTDLARLVFDNDDFSPGSRKPPGDMQKERRFAGANIICNADRHSPMCARRHCAVESLGAGLSPYPETGADPTKIK